MTETLMRFDPVDTLFFRDARPYRQGDTSQSGVVSCFPPGPSTLVGAVRAAYARAMGWNGRGSWDTEVTSQLGDGESLAGIRFRGPFLLESEEPLFPAPASLVGKPASDPQESAPDPLTLLAPGKTRHCDLGPSVRLPEPQEPSTDLKAPVDWWLTREGFEHVLHGTKPESKHFRHKSRLWHLEPRVGIERDRDTRTTGEGAMYSPVHVRLVSDVGIGILVDGLPEKPGNEGDGQLKVRVEARPQPVGGESRMCWLSHVPMITWLPQMPDLPSIESERPRYAVHVVTPLSLEQNGPLESGGEVPGLPGHLVSACLHRPHLWGGWDSVRRKPVPAKPHVPPGSVLFMEADSNEDPQLRNLQGSAIGSRTSWGFGVIAIGSW